MVYILCGAVIAMHTSRQIYAPCLQRCVVAEQGSCGAETGTLHATLAYFHLISHTIFKKACHLRPLSILWCGEGVLLILRLLRIWANKSKGDTILS